MRVRNYQFKPEIRNLTKNEPVREIEWFQPLEDGGCLVWVEGEREPKRGLMAHEEFQHAFVWKKAATMFIKFIGGADGFPKQNIFSKFIIFITLLKYYPLIIRFIHHTLYDYFYDPPSKYSQPVRELYRIFPEELKYERDVACFFMEADHAYKFRFQDIAMELDKEAFKKNPSKEIQRLFDIMISREVIHPKHQKWIDEGTREFFGMPQRWKEFKKVIPIAYWYLRIFKPKLLKRLCQMVMDLKIEEIKPTKEDIYWTNKAPSYNFRGLSYKSRNLIY